jgi:hypothetical protein
MIFQDWYREKTGVIILPIDNPCHQGDNGIEHAKEKTQTGTHSESQGSRPTENLERPLTKATNIK